MSNRAKEIAAIMATYEKGQEWEVAINSHPKWSVCIGEPSWDWAGYTYRRKPTPKTRTRRMTPSETPLPGTAVECGLWSGTITGKHALTGDILWCGRWVNLSELALGYRWFNTVTNTWLPFTITETVYE